MATTLAYKIKQLFDSIQLKAPTNKPMLVGLKEKSVTLASNVIDVELGNAFIRTGLTGAQTFSVINANNVENNAVISFLLSITTTEAASITWWTGIKWNNGSVPALTANGRDTFAFVSYDKGVTWDGYVMSKDSK